MIETSTPNGTLSYNNDGTFTYTPAENYFGADTFTYSVADADGARAATVVALVIYPVNDPPVAQDDFYLTGEDQPLTINPIVANDFDVEDGPGSASAVTVINLPSNGELADLGGGTFTYTPATDFTGTDTFTYTFTDTDGLESGVATVTINVTEENDAPEAADDVFVGNEDDVVTTADITINDTDVEDSTIDPATVVVVDDVSHGTLTNNGNGTFTYTPVANFNGSDSFTYKVTDSEGLESAPATVVLDIAALNDAPAVTNPGPQATSLIAQFDLTVFANDVDGDELTYDATGLPEGLAMLADGTISGTPAPTSSGNYTVTVNVTDDGDPAITTSVSFSLDVIAWTLSIFEGDIVITEVLYLANDLPTREFIEIFNAGTAAVNLAGWQISDGNERVDGVEDVSFVVPATDVSGAPSILAPGEHAVLWLQQHDDISDSATGLVYVGPGTSWSLGNRGDDIWLVDPLDRLVDYVAWITPSPGFFSLGTPPPAELGMWDDSFQETLQTGPLQSISLTPHAVDSNTSACWEPTGSGDANGRCGDVPTSVVSGPITYLAASPGLDNNRFTAAAGGAYVIVEGEDLVLDASDTQYNPTTWEWDLDGDGEFDDASGETPTILWSELVALGLGDDGTYPIALRVNDGLGTAQTEMTITNIAPELTTAGDATVEIGTPYTLLLGAEDPGDDTITSWTINWGDGTIETVTGDLAETTHVYDRAGFTFDILVSATDEDGTYLQNELLVPSYNDAGVYRFAPTTGAFVDGFATGPRPIEVLLGPDGLLYVSSETAGHIRRYEAATGAFVDTFVARDTSSLGEPAGLAFGPDGDLYVADFVRNRVVRFDKDDGSYQGVFAAGGLDEPYDILFGPDANLYVGSYAIGAVDRHERVTGAAVDVFVAPSSGGLDEPEQMTFGPDGNLYIASFATGDVLRYSGTTGAFIDVFIEAESTPLDRPTGITFGPDGNFYVSDFDNDAVQRYDGITGAYIDDYVAAGDSGLSQPGLLLFLSQQQVTVVP